MTALLDTHQHLIYPEVAGYGWTDDIPPLANKAFTVDTYRDLSIDAEIVGSLFMEAGVDDTDYQEETRYVAKLAGNADSGILGIIASCRPEETAGFAQWLDECDDLGVLGYRRILHVVDDSMSQSNTFRRNVREIGSRGKTFDMCFLPKQLPVALELAQSCDNTRLILNHCGVPDIAGGGLDPWRGDIRALATLANVSCKLSGLLAYCAPGEANLKAIQPYVDHVLEEFGPERIVWGSDWPVVELANGLPDWIDVTQQILAQLSTGEASDIGSNNAARIYDVSLN